MKYDNPLIAKKKHNYSPWNLANTPIQDIYSCKTHHDAPEWPWVARTFIAYLEGNTINSNFHQV